ncbi:MAG: SPFH domain-containing protein, partial [Lachnospiraceae bacterium]|nr:SPFH domain-containing protein [Lachnospiraceae bacterium]
QKTTGKNSSNDRKDDRVITNGSLIIVADGQAAVVVSQGKVIDVCAEPGEHVFYDEDHPGGVRGFFKDVWSRIGFGGGDVQPIVHSIYFVDTKECLGNTFLTPEPVPVQLGDPNIGASIDSSVTLSGVFSFRVTDPAVFYRKVSGNVTKLYSRKQLKEQVTAELYSCMQEALSNAVKHGIRPSEFPAHIPEIEDEIVKTVTERTSERLGTGIVSVAIGALEVTDLKTLQKLQYIKILKDPEMAQASLTDGFVEALDDIGKNN